MAGGGESGRRLAQSQSQSNVEFFLSTAKCYHFRKEQTPLNLCGFFLWILINLKRASLPRGWEPFGRWAAVEAGWCGKHDCTFELPLAGDMVYINYFRIIHVIWGFGFLRMWKMQMLDSSERYLSVLFRLNLLELLIMQRQPNRLEGNGDTIEIRKLTPFYSVEINYTGMHPFW